MADRRGLRIAVGTAAVGAALLALALWARDRTPDVAPDFAVPDLSGQAVRLSAYRGQVVLVNIWATWCPPCREEMPSMERQRQEGGTDGRRPDGDPQAAAVCHRRSLQRSASPMGTRTNPISWADVSPNAMTGSTRRNSTKKRAVADSTR